MDIISVIYLQRKLPKHNFPFLTLFQKDNAFFHENIKILTILSLFDLKFCVGLKMYRWSKFKNFAFNKIRFLIKFWKSTIFFIKSANFFVFVLQCTHRENVHNWNRGWARSALNAQGLPTKDETVNTTWNSQKKGLPTKNET